MANQTITAVFVSRRKAEEAITDLSSIGFTDTFIRTSRYLPDFTLAGAGSLPFFSGETHEFDLTTVTGAIPEGQTDEASRIIKKHGGKQ